ncbi:hypothetical protein BD779DRAFT_770746 [Infundibulicybe gibba]|nr:hypothetical protein BD779DRAFT_770746 [Infundibulicybe gibba]
MIKNHVFNTNQDLMMAQPPLRPMASSTFSKIDYRLVARTHFDEFDHYLAAYLAREAPSSRPTARQKLTRLTVPQCYELSTDVYDELIRRKTEGKAAPFLPVRMEFHPKRNQARQKLATLPTSRFQDLCGDVHFELARRYPEFNWESSGRTSPTPSWASEDTYVAGMAHPTRLRRQPSQDTITTLV